MCFHAFRPLQKGQRENTHIIKVRLGNSVTTLFSSTSPVTFAPLNQGPSQGMQPDFYSQELIVVSESSIAEGAVYAFNWLYIFLF